MTTQPQARILVVSDNSVERIRLTALLAEAASTTLAVATVTEAMEHLRSGLWTMVLARADLPVQSGLDLVVQAQYAQIVTPIVLLVDEYNSLAAEAAIQLGAMDYIAMGSLEAVLRPTIMRGMLQYQAQQGHVREQRQQREQLKLERSRNLVVKGQIEELKEATMGALLSALAVREDGTMMHSLRMQAYATHLAMAVQYPATLLPQLQRAAILHDIGKIRLPDSALHLPNVLSPDQVERLKPHTVFGEQILNSLEFLRPAALVVRHHHERFDGAGYPDGLATEDIPLGARILSIADALDAITSDQSYRGAQTFEDAVGEIVRWSGRQFDPRLIAEFRKIPPADWAHLRSHAEMSHEFGLQDA